MPYLAWSMHAFSTLRQNLPLPPPTILVYDTPLQATGEFSNIRPATTAGVRPRYCTGQHMLYLHCHY